MNGTATYGEPVVVVEVDNGHVLLKTGQISSTDTSHVQADNLTRTVVRGDRQWRPGSEEDAHERCFHVSDIHLLRRQEAELLSDPQSAYAWFGSIYQDHMVSKIHRALKRLQTR